MSLDEVQEIFSRIESEVPVSRWVVGDIYIWPIVRIKLFEVLTTPLVKSSEVVASNRRKYRRNKTISILRMMRMLLALLFNKSSIAISYTHYRTSINEISYHRFMDSLRLGDGLDIDLFEIESFAPSAQIKKFGKKNYIFSGYHLLSRIYARVFTTWSAPSYSLPGHDDFIKIIPKNLCLSFCVSSILHLNKDFLQKKKFFDFIFSVNPREIIYVNTYYSLDFLPIVYSARKKSIRVIEIQHGVASSLHPAYSNWKMLSSENMHFFPNEFWFWSEVELEGFRKNNNIKLGESFSKGNLWLKLWEKLSPTFSSELFQKLIIGKNVYLFTLQYHELPSCLFDLCDLLTNDSLLLVRVHPNQLGALDLFTRRLEKYISQGVLEIKMASTLPLPYLLSFTKKHFTLSSTVVIEASYFGVSSVVFSEDALKMYPDLFEQGLVQFVEKISEL